MERLSCILQMGKKAKKPGYDFSKSIGMRGLTRAHVEEIVLRVTGEVVDVRKEFDAAKDH